MTSPEYSSHFSLANIPFGVASSKTHPNPQCVTRLENTVIFLDVLHQAGIFSEIPDLPKGVFSKPTLNDFAALSKIPQRAVREALQARLKGPLPENSTEGIEAVTLHLPVTVGGFTGTSCQSPLPYPDLTRNNLDRFLVQSSPCSQRRSPDFE